MIKKIISSLFSLVWFSSAFSAPVLPPQGGLGIANPSNALVTTQGPTTIHQGTVLNSTEVLQPVNNLSDVSSYQNSRGNLGLPTATFVANLSQNYVLSNPAPGIIYVNMPSSGYTMNLPPIGVTGGLDSSSTVLISVSPTSQPLSLQDSNGLNLVILQPGQRYAAAPVGSALQPPTGWYVKNISSGTGNTQDMQSTYNYGSVINLNNGQPIQINSGAIYGQPINLTNQYSSSFSAAPSTSIVLGMSFTPNQNGQISALGYADTAFSSGTRSVGLWSYTTSTTGTLLATANVVKTDPLDATTNRWRMHAISPIPVSAGVRYVVAELTPTTDQWLFYQTNPPTWCIVDGWSTEFVSNSLAYPPIDNTIGTGPQWGNANLQFQPVSGTGNSSSVIFNDSSSSTSAFIIQSTQQSSVPAPVMTTTQFQSIPSPLQGAFAYASDQATLEFYDGFSFQFLAARPWVNNNFVNLSGMYANPVWITSLAGSKITGNITGNSGGVTGGYVSSITGTANQVNTSGSIGAITLSLPQNVNTSATPTFAGMTLNSTTSTLQLNNMTSSQMLALTPAIGDILFNTDIIKTEVYVGGGGWVTLAFDPQVVHNSGAEFINGTKTFANTINGSINGNAATVTTNANLTGDVTSVGNATTLATVNSSPGTYGDGTHIAQVTVNGKGLVTSSSSVTITGAAPTGVASGDLSGSYPNPTVSKINGNTLGSTTPTSGNALLGNGTQWQSTAIPTSISGTTNQVTASSSTGAVTLSLPQNINNSATPQFQAMTLSGGGAALNLTNNTVSSGQEIAPINFNGLSSTSSPVIYDRIRSDIVSNTNSATTSDLVQSVQENGVLTDYFKLDGSAQLASFLRPLSLSTPLALSSGGTNANLTASNGGIFYSTASAAAILSGTATAGQILQSGASAAPAWSISTFASTYAANNLLFSNGANAVQGLATANNGTLITSASGVPSISSTLPSVVQTNITQLGSSISTVYQNSVQYRFFARYTADNGTATGNGVTYTIVPDTADTNVGSMYSTSTGKVTIPVTGYYHFGAMVYLSALSALNTNVTCSIVTTERTYISFEVAAATRDSNANLTAPCEIDSTFNSGDTVYVTIQVGGGTQTVFVRGSSPQTTYFYGSLLD